MFALPLAGAGLAVGGVWGLYEGLWRPDGKTVRLRMNAVLNGITRRGPFTGNSLGVLGEWGVRVRGCEGESTKLGVTHTLPMCHPCVSMCHAALMYTSWEHTLCKVTKKEDSIVNKVTAASLTGVTFKCTGVSVGVVCGGVWVCEWVSMGGLVVWVSVCVHACVGVVGVGVCVDVWLWVHQWVGWLCVCVSMCLCIELVWVCAYIRTYVCARVSLPFLQLVCDSWLLGDCWGLR